MQIASVLGRNILWRMNTSQEVGSRWKHIGHLYTISRTDRTTVCVSLLVLLMNGRFVIWQRIRSAPRLKIGHWELEFIHLYHLCGIRKKIHTFICPCSNWNRAEAIFSKQGDDSKRAASVRHMHHDIRLSILHETEESLTPINLEVSFCKRHLHMWNSLTFCRIMESWSFEAITEKGRNREPPQICRESWIEAPSSA